MNKKILLLLIPVFIILVSVFSFRFITSNFIRAQTTTTLLWPGDPLNDKLCIGNNGSSVRCSSDPNQTEVNDIAGTYVFIDYNGNKQIDQDELDIPDRTGKCFCGRRVVNINNTQFGGNMSYAYCNQVTFGQTNAQNFDVELYKLEKTNGNLVLRADFRDQYQPTVVIAKRFRVLNNSNITDNLNGSIATTTVTSGNLTKINLNKPTMNSGRPTTWVIFFGIQPQNTNAGNVCANYDVCNITNDTDTNPANDVYKCTNVDTNNVNVRVFVDSNRNGNRDINESCFQGKADLQLEIRQSTNSVLKGGGTRSYNSSSDCNSPIRLTYPRQGSVRLSLANVPTNYTFSGIDGSTNKFTVPINSPRAAVFNANLNNNNINVEYGIYSSTTVPPTTYSISGRIYDDSNPNNSQKDAEEDLIQGNIVLQGSSTNQTITSSITNGYSFTNLTAGTYTVTFNVPTGFTITQPNNVTIPPPSYTVTVGTSCSSPSSATCSNGNISNLNFGLRNNSSLSNNWFQTVGGDVRIDSNFVNKVPNGATCSNTTTPYVSATSTPLRLLKPGIVFSKDTNVNLGATGNQAAKANSQSWLILNNKYKFGSGSIRSSFDYVQALATRKSLRVASLFGTNSLCGTTNGTCNLQNTAAEGVYSYQGNVTVPTSSTFTFTANRDYVILIDGNLTINRDLNAPIGSTVQFIASGNITIGSNVRNIDGNFSANNNFTVLNSTSGTDLDLTIEGSVIANAGLSSGKFINYRDLGANNNSCPSIKIISRPDFVLNSPDFIKIPNFSYQEIAP